MWGSGARRDSLYVHRAVLVTGNERDFAMPEVSLLPLER
jgi:hypothetical protein